MRGLWVAALCAAGALIAGQASAASIVTVDFTVTPGTWDAHPDTIAAFAHFGITGDETFTGSFSYDLDLVTQDLTYGAAADAYLTAFSLTVGDISYTLADIGSQPDDELMVNSDGSPFFWKFQPEKAGDGWYVNDGALEGAVFFDLFDPTNVLDGRTTGTQTVTLPSGPGVPEPASWALMIAGLGMAGGALRRQRAALA